MAALRRDRLARDPSEHEPPRPDLGDTPSEGTADLRDRLRVRGPAAVMDLRESRAALDAVADLRVQHDAGAVIDRLDLRLAARAVAARRAHCLVGRERARPCG